jgi:hypothetical protein
MWKQEITRSKTRETNMPTDIAGACLYAGVKDTAVPGSKAAVAVYTIGSAGALTDCHRFTVHHGYRQCGHRRKQRRAINDELQSALV